MSMVKLSKSCRNKSNNAITKWTITTTRIPPIGCRISFVCAVYRPFTVVGLVPLVVSMSLSSVYPWCYNRGSLVCHSSCMWVEPHPFVNLSSPPPVSSLFVMNVPLVSPLPPSRSVAEVFLCPPELLSSHCWCSFHRTISDMTVSMHDLCAVCRPKVTEGIIALTPKVIPGGVKAKSVMDKLSSKC